MTAPQATGSEEQGAVAGAVRTWLRLEGAVLAAGAIWLYSQSGASWWLLALLALAPDLSFLGYLAGPRTGATIYNLVHSYVFPAIFLAAGVLLAVPLLQSIGLVWIVHIGIDRALGYGLKYPNAFSSTHLGNIGRGPP